MAKTDEKTNDERFPKVGSAEIPVRKIGKGVILMGQHAGTAKVNNPGDDRRAEFCQALSGGLTVYVKNGEAGETRGYMVDIQDVIQAVLTADDERDLPPPTEARAQLEAPCVSCNGKGVVLGLTRGAGLRDTGCPDCGGTGKPTPAPGMSLRDYFAGQALAGIYANDGAVDCTCEEIAADCYRLADAMLAARGGAPAGDDTAARLLLGEVLAVLERTGEFELGPKGKHRNLMESIRMVLR